MYKILAMNEIEGARKLYDALGNVASVTSLPPERETALRIIGEYDGFITPLEFRTDREILDAAKKLKAVFTVTTGLDHIELNYASQKGIPVYGMKNDREFLDSITATAEQALALLLGVMRKIPWAFDSVKQGIWCRDSYKGHQLSGKTIGILGCGRLGTIMAQYAKALRMQVIGCDVLPVSIPDVEMVSISELLRRSDILSVHIHLSDANRGIIGAKEFAQMKHGAVLINTSRGAIVDEAAMLKALDSGILAGAGVDVIDGEWMENKLHHPVIEYARTHENLLISPHVGGACYEAQLMALENTLKKVRDFFTCGCLPCATETLARSLMNGPIEDKKAIL